mmetsp:Transcript_10926/g.15180  ORF Transcript_10926/g.15180 Transcript_10926/m.15180 type:complete len:113 (+) Transcript_10926:22-360(+)
MSIRVVRLGIRGALPKLTRGFVNRAGACHSINLFLSNEWASIRTYSTEKPKPKDPQELIDSVPPIEVDGDTAICNGSSPTSSHPTEYIQLNKVKQEPETCKYCGLRYVQKKH